MRLLWFMLMLCMLGVQGCAAAPRELVGEEDFEAEAE
jgi:hypothetical protein